MQKLLRYMQEATVVQSPKENETDSNSTTTEPMSPRTEESSSIDQFKENQGDKVSEVGLENPEKPSISSSEVIPPQEMKVERKKTKLIPPPRLSGDERFASYFFVASVDLSFDLIDQRQAGNGY